jgi:FMN phosphatase YigB (HAD superfamily)
MIQARLRWGQLDDIPFRHLTSFENSRYCKPQSGYFRDIVEQLGLTPERCLMVGNDTTQDLSAAAVGMQTFLVDTWIVERGGAEWPCEHRGDHGDLQRFLQAQFCKPGGLFGEIENIT